MHGVSYLVTHVQKCLLNMIYAQNSVLVFINFCIFLRNFSKLCASVKIIYLSL
jgi:hypothetical protein